MDKETVDFYERFIRIGFGDDFSREKLKKEYFAEKLQSNTLYKYISFDENDTLNEQKIFAIKNNLLWFAAHHVLRDNDPSEFQINANVTEIARRTNWAEYKIIDFLRTLRELNDLCCLSNRLHDYMWMNYANNYSGCCCVFEVENAEMLMPVLYCDKEKTDFTKEIIDFFNNPTIDGLGLHFIAFISPSLKDSNKYREEQEIRLLCSDIYDSETEDLGGKIAAGKKELIGYKGTYYTYKKCGLKLKKIIVGKNTSRNIADKLFSLKSNIPVEYNNF